MRICGLATTDWHSNSAYGLYNPNVLYPVETPFDMGPLVDPFTGEPVLDDDGVPLRNIKYAVVPTPIPPKTKSQELSWELLVNKHMPRVADFIGKDPVVLFHLGDLAQGFVRPTAICHTNEAFQGLLVRGNFDPWLELPTLEAVRIIKGTEFHEGREGALAVSVATTLRKEGYDSAVAQHWRYEMEGGGLDLSHHGAGPGIRNWLEGNVLRLYGMSQVQDELDAHRKPPIIILRGHYHRYVRGTIDKITPSLDLSIPIIMVPSYSMIDDHARKAAKSPPYVTIGQVVFEVIDGELGRVRGVRDTIDLRVYDEYGANNVFPLPTKGVGEGDGDPKGDGEHYSGDMGAGDGGDWA